MFDLKDLEMIHDVIIYSLENYYTEDERLTNIRDRLTILIKQQKEQEEYNNNMKKYNNELIELVNKLEEKLDN